MKKEVILNNREQKRLLVMNEMLKGRMTGQEAADVLGLTLRHVRRLLAAYLQRGAAALAGCPELELGLLLLERVRILVGGRELHLVRPRPEERAGGLARSG